MEVVADNNPAEIEARTWLNAHKTETGQSWSDLAILTDVASSTLSLFSTGKYGGRNEPVALKVLAYRDRLSVQAELASDAPQVPEWYETPSAKRVMKLLRWAQAGKMVLIVSTPGIGKTKAARRFADSDPNVWLATMAPSTAGVATMAIEVARAVGLGEIKGSPQQLSFQIRNKVAGRRGLLIVDEAQELTDKALNELRGWHDATGVGVALLGKREGCRAARHSPQRACPSQQPDIAAAGADGPAAGRSRRAVRCLGDQGRTATRVADADRQSPRRAARGHHDA